MERRGKMLCLFPRMSNPQVAGNHRSPVGGCSSSHPLPPPRGQPLIFEPPNKSSTRDFAHDTSRKRLRHPQKPGGSPTRLPRGQLGSNLTLPRLRARRVARKLLFVGSMIIPLVLQEWGCLSPTNIPAGTTTRPASSSSSSSLQVQPCCCVNGWEP